MRKTSSEYSLILLRIVVSIIIASHGWHRLATGGSAPFGDWLTTQGLPLGLGIAWFITLFEIVGSPLLAMGKQLLVLCPVYAGIYLAGLVMVHLPHGWFVVGSGRNGVEYSVLLVVSLICIGWPEFANRRRSRGAAG